MGAKLFSWLKCPHLSFKPCPGALPVVSYASLMHSPISNKSNLKVFSLFVCLVVTQEVKEKNRVVLITEWGQ